MMNVKSVIDNDLREKNRKKIQSLLNLGYIILSEYREEQDNANRIVNDLEDGCEFILTIPNNSCQCFRVSNMALKLLKPYIKDLFYIEQKSSSSIYILADVDEDMIEQLVPLKEPNNELQLVDSFEIVFKATTLPNFTNRANLYSLANGEVPPLAPKELNKILELHNRIVENEDTYFLLSNHINHTYNMPMTILRILGENIFSLKALSLLELILIYASNSSALFRPKNEEIKSFVIPLDFFNLEDFELNQTLDEIKNSLKELKNNKLISGFEFVDDTLIINAPIIVKSIKQYSYTRMLHHHRNLDLSQRKYVYTFLNYLRYIKNIKRKEVKTNADGVEELTRIIASDKLMVSLEGLLYQLELDHYIHDHKRLCELLNVLQKEGARNWLLMPREEITLEEIRRLLSRRSHLSDVFILNNLNDVPEDIDEHKPKTYYNSCGRKRTRR